MNKSKKLYLIHEFSEKVGVSKSTLRYYDKLGFFNTVIDEDNRYRFFSEADFFVIQKILSLKLIGFELKDIKKIIKKEIDEHNLRTNITDQIQYMKKKINGLTFLYYSLEAFLPIIETQSYENIITKLLEIIRNVNMIQNIKESWLKEILTPQSLEFLSQKRQLSEEKEQRIVEKWHLIIEEIEKLIEKNVSPQSNEGIMYAERWMSIVKDIGDSPDDRLLGMEVWQAYKEGKIEYFQNQFADQKFFVTIPKPVIFWVDRAVSYMYHVNNK